MTLKTEMVIMISPQNHDNNVPVTFQFLFFSKVTLVTTSHVIGTSLTVIKVNLMNVLGNRLSPYEIAHLAAIHTGSKLFLLDLKHLYLNDKTTPTNVVLSPAIYLGISMKWRNDIN